MTTHCFTMDVEGFHEAMAESFPVPEEALGGPAVVDEVRCNVTETLEVLERHQVKATFFVLGWVAEQLPRLVRAIAEAGHELASHGVRHLRLYNLSPPRVQEVLTRSKKTLEDASGTPVWGFRAPDFSIGKDNLFVIDALLEAGYRYDSSIYPIRGHDVYGLSEAEPHVHRWPNGLVEFPLSTFQFAGRRWPALGGGYFRLYPLALTRRILRAYDKAGLPAMFYIHPYEFGSCCPAVSGLPFFRKFRHYVNRAKTRGRFERLFRQFTFGRVDQVLREQGFLE